MALKRAVTSSLFIRAIGTLLYGVIFLWLVFTGGVALFIGVAIIAALAAYEFYALMTRGGYRPLYVIGIATALLFVFSVYFTSALQDTKQWRFA